MATWAPSAHITKELCDKSDHISYSSIIHMDSYGERQVHVLALADFSKHLESWRSYTLHLPEKLRPHAIPDRH